MIPVEQQLGKGQQIYSKIFHCSNEPTKKGLMNQFNSRLSMYISGKFNKGINSAGLLKIILWIHAFFILHIYIMHIFYTVIKLFLNKFNFSLKVKTNEIQDNEWQEIKENKLCNVLIVWTLY